jgi:very-short-patch-repair endonuclease
MPPRRSDEEIRTLVKKMLVKENLLKSEDDTDFRLCNEKICQKHFTSNGLEGLIAGRFNGSPIAAMKFCFPDYAWDSTLLRKIPQGHWLNTENVKTEVERIRTQRGWSIEDCYKLKKDDYPAGIHDIYPSRIDLLRAVYPEVHWEPWRMVPVSRDVWDDFENHKKVVQYEEKRQGVTTPEDWWDKLDGDTFHDFQGLIQLRYASSPSKLLSAVYPQLGTKLWMFKKTPKNFWTDETVVEFLSDFAEHRGIITPEGWYIVTCDDIKAHGGAGLVSKYKSHIDIITQFAPVHGDFKWNRAKFKSTWATERIVGDYLSESNAILRGREFRPDWLRGKTSSLEMDITFRDRRVCVEVDGGGHFKTMWYGPHEGTFRRDIQKMKATSQNGYSGIRIYQPDVYANKFNWKEWISNAIVFIESQSNPCWVFQKSVVYDRHVAECIAEGINVHILE